MVTRRRTCDDAGAMSRSRTALSKERPLTRRELNVLRHVSLGGRSREIAAELEVSEATVKAHLYNIYRKLGIDNRAAATRWYVERYPG
jgi:DNA-binding NarL/FixJ family response regulator